MERILLSESRCTPFVSGEQTSSVLTVGQTVPVKPFNPRRRTTTVEFQGRLGNVLFGYAAGLTVQSRRGGELHFLDWRTPSRSDFETYVDPDGSEGIANYFRGARYFTRHRLVDKVGWRVLRQLRRALRRLRVFTRELRIVEQCNAFSPFVSDIDVGVSRRLLLIGYFQHPTWFEPSLDAVTSQVWTGLTPHVAGLLQADATVISVRRGDYVSLGWDLLPNFYERAIDALGRIDGPIWITSDDPVAAQAMLEPILRDRNLVAAPLPNLYASPAMRDFALLCTARNVIMSNSTFCWWGTVTGQLQGNQPKKTVICPTPWLATYPNSDVLFRPDWTLIEATFGGQMDSS